MSAYVLGVDIGTSACKVALFDAQGHAAAQGTSEYAVSYPRKGWAEQNPEDWWRGACIAIRQAMEAGNISPYDIAGIGVDGQSWSAVAVDGHGRALAPTPIWTDTRSADICAQIKQRVDPQALFALCGNPLQPGYTLPKILWMQRHLPDVYARTDTFLQSNGYIVMRMTGARTQDASQGYGLACFDMQNGCWDDAMCARLGVRRSLLPDVCACDEVVGRLTQDAAEQTGLVAGIPVVAGGLDAACGTLGAGVTSAGQAQEQGGQAGGMSLCIDRCIADERLILSRHVVPGRWLLQGGTTGGGGALRWLRQTMCPELSFAQMSALAASAPPGSGGVIFLPYMAGERSPIWNPDARGVFFGLDYAATRAHMIRAVMEGVAYALRHNLETAAEAGARAGTLRATGGSALSETWTQIKADITGKTIEVPPSATATTLGAALLAGVGVGMFGSFADAVGQTVRVERVHSPDPENAGAYERGYQAYRALYERLSPMMKGSDAV